MSDLTPEQETSLANERYLQQILEIRGLLPARNQKEAQPPNPWLAFLQSSSGTALITVLIGGIFGSVITARMAERDRQRDLRTAAFNEFSKEQRVHIDDAFALTAQAVSCAEDLGTLATRPFYIGADDGLTKDQEVQLNKQRQDVITAYNNIDKEWRSKRYSIGLLVGAFNSDGDAIAQAWAATAASVQHFMDCEHAFALDHLTAGHFTTRAEAQASCQADRNAFEAAQPKLFSALSHAEQQYLNPKSD